MALWKEQPNVKKTDTVPPSLEDTSLKTEPLAVPSDHSSHIEPVRSPKRSEAAESVIGADLTIEGSIAGSGNVRLAGRFTGDVTVDGMVTIEAGAKLAGGVRATTVVIAGELEGNVVEAGRVDVLASGVLMGDLKAEMLTLAAGSRVRGHVECGWSDTPSRSRGGQSAMGPGIDSHASAGNVRSITPASPPTQTGNSAVAGAERATGA